MNSIYVHAFVGLAFLLNLVPFSQAAGQYYEFSGKKFKLAPYVDQEPRTLRKVLDLKSQPQSINLMADQTQVKDQGDRGSCAYFSSTALLESLIKRNIGEDINISEEYLIFYTKSELGQDSNVDGSVAWNNLNAFKDGFMLEKDVPYQPSWFVKGLACEGYNADDYWAPSDCYSHHRPSDLTMQKKISLNDLKTLQIESSTAEIIRVMNLYHVGVIVSVPVHYKGWNSETGYAYFDEELRRDCQQSPDACGGHSVMIVGYDLMKKELYFKNSWGYRWGNNGYGIMPFSFIDHYSQGTAVTGVLEDAKVHLPKGHSQIPVVEVTNVHFEIQKDSTIGVSLVSEITGLVDRVYYSSIYLGRQLDSFLSVSDENVDLIRKADGNYLRGPFTCLPFDYSAEGRTTISSQMQIPMTEIDSSVFGAPNLYVRISNYFYDDIEGWNLIWRAWEPITL